MSKIICDVCGTSYPETAEQCPICGSARPADIQGIVSDTEIGENSTGYTYVKGGRFSKANVKKRNSARQDLADDEPEYSQPQIVEEDEKTNKGLIITAIALFVAIILLVGYICIRFLGNDDSGETQPQTLPTQTVIDEPTEPEEIPCIGLKIANNDSNSILFSAAGDAYMLTIETTPENSTDIVSFACEDELIATVSEKGKVVAVAPGQTVIKITCGQQELNCIVICDWEEPTEETTEPTEPEIQYTAEDLSFKTFKNSGDITIDINQEIKLYNGNIPLEEVTFTSDDDSVATIKDGKVLGLRNGITKVYAQYGEFKIECIVRVTAKEYGGLSGSDNISPA